MYVTIQDAINAFALLSEHVNENGFLHECYNLGMSALKTIQDGNYTLSTQHVSRETLKKLAEYECKDEECIGCKYYHPRYICISAMAEKILKAEDYERRILEWIAEQEKK